MKSSMVRCGLVILVVLTTAIVWSSPPATPAPSPNASRREKEPTFGRVVAKVNNDPIFEAEFKETCVPYKAMLDSLPKEDRRARLEGLARRELDKLIDREAAATDALKEIQSDPNEIKALRQEAAKEFQTYLNRLKTHIGEQFGKEPSDQEMCELLKKAGLTLELLRRKTERQYIAQSHLMKRADQRLGPDDGKDARKRNRMCCEEIVRLQKELRQKAKVETFDETLRKVLAEM